MACKKPTKRNKNYFVFPKTIFSGSSLSSWSMEAKSPIGCMRVNHLFECKVVRLNADSEFWIVAEIAEDDVNDRIGLKGVFLFSPQKKWRINAQTDDWWLTKENVEFITCVPLQNSTCESVSSEIGVCFVCDACELKRQEWIRCVRLSFLYYILFSGNFIDIYLRAIAKPKTLAGILKRRTSAGCNGIPHMAYTAEMFIRNELARRRSSHKRDGMSDNSRRKRVKWFGWPTNVLRRNPNTKRIRRKCHE